MPLSWIGRVRERAMVGRSSQAKSSIRERERENDYVFMFKFNTNQD